MFKKNKSFTDSFSGLPAGALAKAGFTLLELIVVSVISAIMVNFLIQGFGGKARRDQALRRSIGVLQAEIRRVQAISIAGKSFVIDQICGYGVHYLDASRYQIYKGASQGFVCSSTNHNFQSGIDSVFQTLSPFDPNVQFQSSFSDIFFEPPDPKIYINNDANLSLSPVEIKLCYKNTSDCKSMFIYTSGRFEVP